MLLKLPSSVVELLRLSWLLKEAAQNFMRTLSNDTSNLRKTPLSRLLSSQSMSVTWARSQVLIVWRLLHPVSLVLVQQAGKSRLHICTRIGKAAQTSETTSSVTWVIALLKWEISALLSSVISFRRMHAKSLKFGRREPFTTFRRRNRHVRLHWPTFFKSLSWWNLL